jgi:phosphotransferase system  glucose/maltose/N-acetylglucosamine-specific IIC component
MATFYQSSPFKESIHRNYLLLLWVIGYFSMAIALTFKPGFFGALSLDESLEEHQLFMLGIISIPFVGTVVMLIFERVIRNYFKWQREKNKREIINKAKK